MGGIIVDCLVKFISLVLSAIIVGRVRCHLFSLRCEMSLPVTSLDECRVDFDQSYMYKNLSYHARRLIGTPLNGDDLPGTQPSPLSGLHCINTHARPKQGSTDISNTSGPDKCVRDYRNGLCIEEK